MTSLFRLAGLACGVTGVLLAQSRSQSLPEHPGRFPALTVNMPRASGGPRPVDARAMKARLDSVVAVLRRTPLLAEPRGFDITGSLTVAEAPLPESEPGWVPVRGSLLLIPLLWYRRCDTCEAMRSGEGVGAQIGINNLSLAMTGSGTGGCGGPRVFTESREVTRVGGFPMYNNGAVVISARDVPHFIPITRDEWIDAQVNATKNQYGCNRPDARRKVFYDSIRASWTPEERAQQAFEPSEQTGRGPIQFLVPPGTPRARRYVRVNPALFDSTLARTAIQTIVITVAFPRRDPRQFPRGTRAPLPCAEPIPRSPTSQLDALAIHETVWCNVDYAALRALLR